MESRIKRYHLVQKFCKRAGNDCKTGRAGYTYRNTACEKCKDAGYGMIATGEMGIGNTTTSSAVAAALLGCEAEEVTGKGAGLPNDKIKHKVK